MFFTVLPLRFGTIVLEGWALFNEKNTLNGGANEPWGGAVSSKGVHLLSKLESFAKNR